jgi:hypothetical protein
MVGFTPVIANKIQMLVLASDSRGLALASG